MCSRFGRMISCSGDSSATSAAAISEATRVGSQSSESRPHASGTQSSVVNSPASLNVASPPSPSLTIQP